MPKEEATPVSPHDVLPSEVAAQRLQAEATEEESKHSQAPKASPESPPKSPTKDPLDALMSNLAEAAAPTPSAPSPEKKEIGSFQARPGERVLRRPKNIRPTPDNIQPS